MGVITLRGRIVMTLLGELRTLTENDRQKFEKGAREKLSRDKQERVFEVSHNVDKDASPRTKALIQAFQDAQGFDQPKRFLFEAKSVRQHTSTKGAPRKTPKKTPTKEEILKEAEERVVRLRKELQLPPAIFPDNDPISNAMQLDWVCPFCGSDNLSSDDYEGEPHKVTCEVECDDCGAVWTETYTFNGASVVTHPATRKEQI